jgi:amino acid transporter
VRQLPSAAAAGLRPVLSLWQIVFYGLGVIVGAGIYVAIGSVIARAGEAAPLLVALLVVAFTLIAVWGVRESVGLAATIGAFEIAGLVAAAAVGFALAPEYDLRGMLPADARAWQSTVAGAFIAFFAFIGFETLVNLAEETIAPERTLPRGIIGAIGASIVLYVVVVSAVVLADTGTENPLLALFGGVSATLFAAVATVSVANGVLIQIVMLARLFSGMAARGQLPDVLARVHP